MNNFFEQELRKLFGDGEIIDDPTYSGRSCFGTLGKDLRVRAQFISTYISNQYDALKLTVLNRTDGPVDTLVLKLKDLLGMKPLPSRPNSRDGVAPHIWDDHGNADWYIYHPITADYKTIRQAAEQYLGVFRDRQQERTRDGPKLVYICAPLRGDVEKNIEFARQKAREVFQAGDIPVCPQLITDLENPKRDQEMREMGLRLVESCQEVHVYGPEWTEGMWAEIRHAMDLGIEVKTDQQTLGRSQPHRQAARKGKETKSHER